jgi:hypothetical protein
MSDFNKLPRLPWNDTPLSVVDTRGEEVDDDDDDVERMTRNAAALSSLGELSISMQARKMGKAPSGVWIIRLLCAHARAGVGHHPPHPATTTTSFVASFTSQFLKSYTTELTLVVKSVHGRTSWGFGPPSGAPFTVTTTLPAEAKCNAAKV